MDILIVSLAYELFKIILLFYNQTQELIYDLKQRSYQEWLEKHCFTIICKHVWMHGNRKLVKMLSENFRGMQLYRSKIGFCGSLIYVRVWDS